MIPSIKVLDLFNFRRQIVLKSPTEFGEKAANQSREIEKFNDSFIYRIFDRFTTLLSSKKRKYRHKKNKDRRLVFFQSPVFVDFVQLLYIYKNYVIHSIRNRKHLHGISNFSRPLIAICISSKTFCLNQT